MTTVQNHVPLLIFQMDGGKFDWLEQWVREGYLPTIARLMSEGCWGTLESEEQYMEYGTELSLYSGLSRGEHGYYHYRRLDSGTYNLQPAVPQDANAAPFWNYLPQDYRVAILDLVEVPLVNHTDGIQLINWVGHQSIIPPLPPSSLPAELVADVQKIYGQREDTEEYKADATAIDDIDSFQCFMRQIEKKGRLCRELLQRDHFDVIVTSFYEVHRAGHRLWKYHKPDNKHPEILNHMFRKLYQAIDRELGLLLESLPQLLNIVFVSPYSMKSQYPTGGLTEDFCLKLGYQIPQNTSSKGGISLNPLSLARQWVPEKWRIALSERISSSMQEHLLASRLRDSTDWSKTTAFALPTVYTGLVRINLYGREPQGIIRPGDEYWVLLNQLRSDLKQLIDPETGESIVEQITCPAELYGGTPTYTLPDLFIEWKAKNTFINHVMYQQTEITQRKPAYFRNSWHDFQGFWVATGPNITVRSQIKKQKLLDFPPTFLHLLGQETPAIMSGQAIKEWF